MPNDSPSKLDLDKMLIYIDGRKPQKVAWSDKMTYADAARLCGLQPCHIREAMAQRRHGCECLGLAWYLWPIPGDTISILFRLHKEAPCPNA